VLVVEDTGEDAESAVAALEKLVLEQGVIGVVGPLRSDVSDPVLEAADALRVPVVALSRTDHATADRQWVFQSMVTTHQLADALVEFAVTEQQMTGFAVFAPDTPYGHTATEAFQAAVEEQGAQVTVVEFYDAEATDLIPFAKTLGRKDYEARWREFRDLKEAAEETGANPDRVVLPPTIDFQGLFLPDAAARVPLACAALAYEEFPIGHFQTVKEGPTIPLLGLSSWNNPTLVTAGNVYVRGSYFTDVFYPGDEPGAAFVETYRTALERTPTTLEAVAFDTGLLLGGAAVSEAQTRAAFRDALLAVQVEGTITGATGFDPESREALHDIRVLSITEEEILPWDQVPADEGPQ